MKRIALVCLVLAPLALLAPLAWRNDDSGPPSSIRATTAPVVAEAQPRTVSDEKRAAGVPTTIEGR